MDVSKDPEWHINIILVRLLKDYHMIFKNILIDIMFFQVKFIFDIWKLFLSVLA
jgi:hypothetical protein